ncbi:MAG: site-specific integrase [Methanophagales archaeon]|nr:site-specific integrase [Methanophagales archaeon]
MPHKRRESNTERLIRQFYKHLKLKKGISEGTASAHAGRIEFFASHYLRDYEDKSLINTSGRDIENYLGNWYIRKVLNSSKSDVHGILVAFKKFFKFLFDKGKIEKGQLDDILEACASPQRYISRFESYDALDPESDTWNIDFENWFMGEYEEEAETQDYNQLFDVNTGINKAFSEEDLNSSRTTVLTDFQAFLNYISANSGMKLTPANSFIGRKHLFALNEAMSSPEELKSTANQPDSRVIHLFYNLGRTLGMFIVSERNTLEVTPRIELFKKTLSPKEQFVVLLDAMWNETRWDTFLAPYSGGRPERAQAMRGDIARLFARCEPGETYLFKEELNQLCMEVISGDTENELISIESLLLMADFIVGVFTERIMPALKFFGLLDFGFPAGRNEYSIRHGYGIAWFSISELGKKIFGVLVPEEQ